MDRHNVSDEVLAKTQISDVVRGYEPGVLPMHLSGLAACRDGFRTTNMMFRTSHEISSHRRVHVSALLKLLFCLIVIKCTEGGAKAAANPGTAPKDWNGRVASPAPYQTPSAPH